VFINAFQSKCLARVHNARVSRCRLRGCYTELGGYNSWSFSAVEPNHGDKNTYLWFVTAEKVEARATREHQHTPGAPCHDLNDSSDGIKPKFYRPNLFARCDPCMASKWKARRFMCTTIHVLPWHCCSSDLAVRGNEVLVVDRDEQIAIFTFDTLESKCFTKQRVVALFDNIAFELGVT